MMMKANDDRLVLGSRMLKLKMKSLFETAPGAAEGRAFTLIARVPYGESTFKRNRPSFAVLMVLGGGGGDRERERSEKEVTSP